MIKVECSTTDYAVLKAVGELFTKLAGAGATPAKVAEKTGVSECACKEVMDVAAPVVTETAAPAPVVTETAAPAPVVTETAAAPPEPNSVELDDTGMPWDGRINTESRTKLKADGSWKLKRGIDPKLVESVRAELRDRIDLKEPAAAPVAIEPAAAAPVAIEPAAAAPPEPPIAAPVATEPAAAPAPKLGVPTTFPGLLQAFTYRQSIGKITPEEMDQICVGQGIPSLAMIASRPDLIPQVFESMEALCNTRP